MAMSKSDYKLTNKTKHPTAATDNCPVSGASAVEKRASFDSGYHSNYGGAGEGEGEGEGKTSNNAGTIYYPPNGPGKSETPQSGAELFGQRLRQMLLEAEGVMGVQGSNGSAASTNNAYTYTDSSGK
ncbi:hypothetical protein G6514_006070 [Epicoccum nigrum]|nr:hypothetical protein G6514_006070 [Epicoccum nigrum]